MLRLVLRPLLVILTLGALLVALIQVAGRVTFHFLDKLEPTANQLLSGSGVHLRGLSGDWHMLDPVVRVDRIDLPAGHLDGVVLEVDAIESVLRGALLARRLKVADAEITLEKHPGQPWRLAGAAGSGQLDPLPVLEESDQLELDGALRFVRDGVPPARVAFHYLGLNRGGAHRHALTLANDVADCRSGRCTLSVNFQRQDQLWPLRERQARLTTRSDGFLLPRPVLGFSPLALARLDLDWQRTGPVSGGALSLRTEQLDMPGDVTLAVNLNGTVRGRDGVHTGAISDWRVEQGDGVWQLPPMAVTADAGAVSVWMPELDLGRAAGFLGQALAAVEPARRWLTALDIHGSARDVRASYGLDGAGLRYAMMLDQVAMEGYKGVPTVRGAAGELFGYQQGLQVNLNAQGVGLAFPDVFTGDWTLPYAQGVLQAWFSPGYFGVRGLNLRGETDGTRAAGAFAMSRPPDREGQRLALLLSAGQMPVAQAQQFVPYKLPDQLKSWLLTAPRGGVLEDARLAYQGQFQEEPGELGRRIELTARIRDGAVRYHPDWPEVSGVSGGLTVAGSEVDVNVDQGQTAGARIAGSRVQLVDNASAADIELDAEVGADAALDFLRTTPLSARLSFLQPDWRAQGPMRLSGELHVPLGSDGEPAVRLRGDLAGVDVNLPDYRVAVNALDGSFRYRYPYYLDASGVSGRMFGAPVTVGASTSDDRVHLTFSGRASPADVWQVLQMDDPQVASGTFDFTADLGLGVAGGVVSQLAVRSNLEGTAVTLPAGFGKPAELSVPADVRLAFLPGYRAVRFHYQSASGWLHFDQAPLSGAIGFASPPMGEDEAADSLVLNGRLQRFDLEDVIPDGTAGSLPLPIRLEGLNVGAIGIGGVDVTRATLNGLIDSSGFTLAVDSAEIKGSLERRGARPMKVSLARVALPGGKGRSDPLRPDVIPRLPAADVNIQQLTIGDDDYGSWHFALRPVDGNLEVRDLKAAVRGVAIDSPAGLVWRGDSDQTHFDGAITAGNLADVLTQWGYAPSVETRRASLSGDFVWSGSPLMVDLLSLRGHATLHAKQGRFLDVESGAGALKVFSLLNFTAIAKRLSLNFSDVFGRGVSFDDLDAHFSLDAGRLAFLDPMQVKGTGSEFKVTGSVNLTDGTLDNDMIVTLPVTKGLPWYAAYVALANPLAGLGVLVGERVLRKPLEQFSSARYHIGGTLENPDVKFMKVFDATPPDTPAAADDAGGAAQGEEGPPAAGAVAPASGDAGGTSGNGPRQGADRQAADGDPAGGRSHAAQHYANSQQTGAPATHD